MQAAEAEAVAKEKMQMAKSAANLASVAEEAVRRLEEAGRFSDAAAEALQADQCVSQSPPLAVQSICIYELSGL